MYFAVSALFFLLFSRIFTLPERVEERIVKGVQEGIFTGDFVRMSEASGTPFRGWTAEVLGATINVPNLPQDVATYKKQVMDDEGNGDSAWQQTVKKRLIEIRPLLAEGKKGTIDFFGVPIDPSTLAKSENDYLAAQKKLPKERQASEYEQQVTRQIIFFRDMDRGMQKRDNDYVMTMFGERINLATVPERISDYNKQQQTLDPMKRDGFWKQYITKILIQLRRNPIDVIKSLLYGTLPLVLFLTLPVFAALLKLFYLRQGHYYVEHLVFTVHNHTIMFIVLGIDMIIENRLPQNSATPLLGILTLSGLCLYWYLAMKRVYGGNESALTTFIKGFLLNQGYGCLLFFTFLIGLLINLIWTLLNL
jgi:hypothetical protein